MSIDSHELVGTASRLDVDGRGIVETDAGLIMVQYLLPGERATLKVIHKSPHRRVAWADIIEREGPLASARQTPRCEAYGECGGCAWQHLGYAAQCELKRERVVDALKERLGAEAPVVAPVLPAPSEFGYRNKGKFVIGGVPGAIVLGAYRPRTHDLVSTLGCAVVAPAIERLGHCLRNALDNERVRPYDERSGEGHWRYAIVRQGHGSSNHVLLVGRSDTPARERTRVAEALMDAEAEGVSFCENDTSAGGLLTESLEPIAGKTTWTTRLGGRDIELDATSFWQVNSDQARVLYAMAADIADVTPGERVLDLYCGVGGFAFELAERGAQVTGIEVQENATKRARAHAAAHGLSPRFVHDLAESAPLESYDLVVVNPPRKGLSAKTVGLLRQIQPKKLVYVSCNPDSLARNLQELSDLFTIDSVLPIDLMPGTGQVETMVRLTRR